MGISFRKKHRRIFTDSKWLGDGSCGVNYTTGDGSIAMEVTSIVVTMVMNPYVMR